MFSKGIQFYTLNEEQQDMLEDSIILKISRLYTYRQTGLLGLKIVYYCGYLIYICDRFMYLNSEKKNEKY